MGNRSLLRRAFLGGLAAVSSGLAAGWMVSLFDSDAEDDRPMANQILKKLRIRPNASGGGGGTPPVDPGTFAATHTLGVGRLTMGQAIPKGQVPAGQGLAFSGLATQCDIKTTWDDGSARFAVLSANVATAGDYPLAVGSAATGTFSPTIPSASVTLTIGGTSYVATLPASVSSDPWLAGPICREWRHLVTPKAAGNVSHAFLRVIFDVRVYAAGGSRVDVTVENCLDTATSSAVTYNCSVSVAGSVAYTLTSQPHYYLTRWRKAFAAAGLAESSAAIDWSPAVAAGALPGFRSTAANPTFDLSGPEFAPMGRGSNLYANMGTTGGRAEIAPYPDWAAAYVVHRAANHRAATILNSDLAGSWPIHYRDASGAHPSIDDRPDFWLDYRGADQPLNPTWYDHTGSLQPDLSHVPSFSYVPYLATGDRYHADEMGFWAHVGLIGTYPASLANYGRGQSTGIVGVEQVRGRAWGLRNLADAAAYLPDSAGRSYLAAKVANNTAYYGGYATARVAEAGNPLGFLYATPGIHPSPAVVTSLWQHAYLAWSLEHARRQGFAGGESFRDAVAALQLRFLTSGPDYPFEYGGPYWPIVGSTDTGLLFTTMAQVFAATFTSGAEAQTSFVGFYGLEARLSLMLAVASGLPGAQAVLDQLMAVSGMPGYVDSRPGFAIDARQPGDA